MSTNHSDERLGVQRIADCPRHGNTPRGIFAEKERLPRMSFELFGAADRYGTVVERTFYFTHELRRNAGLDEHGIEARCAGFSELLALRKTCRGNERDHRGRPAAPQPPRCLRSGDARQ